MAKLAILLALTLAALIIAFGYNVSACKTNPKGSQDDCSSQVKVEQLNQCQMHLTQGTNMNLKMTVEDQDVPYLQMCCTQLKNVDKQCQCNAIQKVFDEARLQRRGGVVVVRQMLRKAQSLPNDCDLEVQDCPLAAPRV